jgi:hypothetical protein
LEYIETSAATGENVEKALNTLLDKVMLRMEKSIDTTLFPVKSFLNTEKPESSYCSC